MRIVNLLISLIFLILCSCQDKLKSLDDTAIEVSVINGEDVTYTKKIKHEGNLYSISLAGNGDIRFLDIRVSHKGVLITKMNDEIDGIIYEVLKSDLNHNDKPELVLLVKANDLQSRISIVGYEHIANTFKRLNEPSNMEDLFYGYSGSDHIYIKVNKLVWEFLAVNYSDTNRTSSISNTVLFTLDNSQNMLAELYGNKLNK